MATHKSRRHYSMQYSDLKKNSSNYFLKFLNDTLKNRRVETCI